MVARALAIAALVVVTAIAGSSAVASDGASRAGTAPAPAAASGRAADAAPAERATLPGLDVSAYQHGVNWRKASAKGARFAYVKATEGVRYTSARFREQYTGAARAGLARGAFHFAKPNASTAVAQAEYFVRALRTVDGDRATGSATLPPLVDLEYDPYVRTDGTDSCWGLTPKQMVVWVSSFVDTVTGLTGRMPAIYTTTDWWKRCTSNSPDFGQNPLFLARYVDDPASGPGALPAGWDHWTIWQYTSRGSRYAGVTDGKKGDTPASDEDLFAGSAAELRALAEARFDDVTGLDPAYPAIVSG
ncbi:GH25 family lysozyme [Frondihabitans peucedani]|uniref:Hydrolase n=1 Tax=Frondihabitans peucedani TaxID=598626 RepID=A0ABP8E274_9MICO